MTQVEHIKQLRQLPQLLLLHKSNFDSNQVNRPVQRKPMSQNSSVGGPDDFLIQAYSLSENKSCVQESYKVVKKVLEAKPDACAIWGCK